jgi:glycosyltransferase involved in cell wall biosynthesis
MIYVISLGSKFSGGGIVLQEIYSSAKKRSLEVRVIEPPSIATSLLGRMSQIIWIILWPLFTFSSPANKVLVTHSLFLLSPFVFLLGKKKIFFLFQGEEYRALRSKVIVRAVEWLLRGRFKHFKCFTTNDYLCNVAQKMGGHIVPIKINLGPKQVFFRNHATDSCRKYVIIFARNGYNKALNDALEVAQLVHHKLPVHFLAPDEATSIRVRAHGLNCTVSVDSEQICGYLEQAIALFLPSHYEGLSLPMLEALATGTPVVTYAEGFPQVFSRFNKHVRFVKDRNAAATFQQLVEISEDPIYKDIRKPLISIDEFSFEEYCDGVAGFLAQE